SDLAPLNYGPVYDTTDYGRAVYDPYTISEDLKRKVDLAVEKVVDDGWKRTVAILKKYRKQLDKVADKLLEIESMDEDDFTKAVGSPKVKAE
ncbi:MAG TPA: hypothetical protein VLH19_03320, partial [Patescibacteria group bacterium]|nr:hypothetical protein [Patescibacteria group bacterium]